MDKAVVPPPVVESGQKVREIGLDPHGWQPLESSGERILWAQGITAEQDPGTGLTMVSGENTRGDAFSGTYVPNKFGWGSIVAPDPRAGQYKVVGLVNGQGQILQPELGRGLDKIDPQVLAKLPPIAKVPDAAPIPPPPAAPRSGLEEAGPTVSPQVNPAYRQQGMSRRGFLGAVAAAVAGAAAWVGVDRLRQHGAVPAAPAAAPARIATADLTGDQNGQYHLEKGKPIPVFNAATHLPMREMTPAYQPELVDAPGSYTAIRVAPAGDHVSVSVEDHQGANRGFIPPTHVPPIPSEIFQQMALAWGRYGEAAVEYLARGPADASQWSAGQGAWLIPPGAADAVVTLNDPWSLDWIAGGAQAGTLDALFESLASAGRRSGARVGLAYEIGGLVSGKPYRAFASMDDPMPDVVRVARRNIEAARSSGVRVYASGSGNDWPWRRGEGTNSLLSALNTGLFDTERLYLDIEIWRTPIWQEAHLRDDREALRMLARMWLDFLEEEVLKKVVPAGEPGTVARDGWSATQVHAYVTPEFLELLDEVARERGRPISPRITPEVMSYKYPVGQEATPTRNALRRAGQIAPDRRQAASPVVNLTPGTDPNLAGRSADELQGILGRMGGGSVTINVREALSLIQLARDGRLSGGQLLPVDGETVAAAADRLQRELNKLAGLPEEAPIWEQLPRPGGEPVGEGYRRFSESGLLGLFYGVLGGAPIYQTPRAVFRMVQGELRINPDILPAGPEVGTTVKMLLALFGAIGGGRIYTERADLVVYELDGNGRKIPGTEREVGNILGDNSPVILSGGGRYGGEIRLHVQRNPVPVELVRAMLKRDLNLAEGQEPTVEQMEEATRLLGDLVGWNGALAVSMSTQVAKGHQASGDTPREQWSSLTMDLGETARVETLPIAGFHAGPNWITLRTFDVHGQVTELLGPGTNLQVTAQRAGLMTLLHLAWLRAMADRLPEKEAALRDELRNRWGREPSEREMDEQLPSADLRTARQELQMNELALETGGQADGVAEVRFEDLLGPFTKSSALQRFEDVFFRRAGQWPTDERLPVPLRAERQKLAEKRRRLEDRLRLLKASGVTAVALRLTDAAVDDFYNALLQRDLGSSAQPRTAQQLKEIGQFLHQLGFRVGIEVSASHLSDLRDKPLSEHREKNAKKRGLRMDTATDTLRVIIDANEKGRWALDFVACRMPPAPAPDESRKWEQFRTRMEVFFEQRDISFLAIGPPGPGAVSTDRSQYAAAVSTLDQIRAHLQTVQLRKPWNRRFAHAVAFEGSRGGDLDSLLEWLGGFPSLGRAEGGERDRLWGRYAERLTVPSGVALNRFGILDPAQVREIQGRARQADHHQLSEAYGRGEAWAIATVESLAIQTESAHVDMVGRFGTFFDHGVLRANGIRLMPIVETHSERPEVLPLQPKITFREKDGSAIIGVEVANHGNQDADYDVYLFLNHSYDPSQPAGPANWPGSARHVKTLRLRPGEQVPARWRIEGLPSKEQSSEPVEYRIVVIPRGAQLFQPGMPASMDPNERALARFSGQIWPGLHTSRADEEITAEILSQQLPDFWEWERHRVELGYPIGSDMADRIRILNAHLRGFAKAVRTPEGSLQFSEPDPANPRRMVSTVNRKAWEDLSMVVAGERQELVQLNRKPAVMLNHVPALPATTGLKRLGTVAWWLGPAALAALAFLGLDRFFKRRDQVRLDRVANRLAEEQAQRLTQAGFDDLTESAGLEETTGALATGRVQTVTVGEFGFEASASLAAGHPEQGKALRGLARSYKEVVGVLNRETQELSSNTQSQRLSLFQRLRGKLWGAIATTVAAAVAVPLALIGATPVGAAVAVGAVAAVGLGWYGFAKLPAAQRAVGWVLERPGAMLQNPSLNRGFALLSAPLLLGTAAGAAFVLGVPVGTVFSVAAVGMVASLFLSRAVESPSPETLFRAGGAMGLYGLGVAAVLKLSTLALTVTVGGIALPLFWPAAAAIALLTFVLANRMEASPQPLAATVGALTGFARFLAKWGAIGTAGFLIVKVAGGAAYGWWAAHVAGVALAGASLPLMAGIAAVAAILLYFRFEFARPQIQALMDRVGVPERVRPAAEPALRWVAAALGGWGVILLAPVVMPLLGIPATVGGMMVAVGLLCIGFYMVNKAVTALHDPRQPSESTYHLVWRRATEAIWQMVVTAAPLTMAFLLFKGAVVYGLAGPVGLAIGISFAAFTVWPLMLGASAINTNAIQPLRFWVQRQFEKGDDLERQASLRQAISLLDGLAGIQGVASPLTVAPSDVPADQLEPLFDQLCNAMGLPQAARADLFDGFNRERRPPAGRAQTFDRYDPVLLAEAWVRARADAPRRGISQHGFPPAPGAVALSEKQMRLVNWHYWLLLSARQAVQFLGGNSAVPAAGLDAEFKRIADSQGLTSEDRLELVEGYQGEHLKAHCDVIFGQDDGTTLRAFGQGFFTGEFAPHLDRFRNDDAKEVMMPALILSLSWDQAYTERLSGQKKDGSRYSRREIAFAWLTSPLQILRIALVNYAVPVGFRASMVNRTIRAALQPGNTMSTLIPSGDAGVEGYMGVLEYLKKVMGRWLKGHIGYIAEVMLGRRIVWNAEEALAPHRSESKHGTIQHHVERLMEQARAAADLAERRRLLTAASYAALMAGAEIPRNEYFEQGHSRVPVRLFRVGWDEKTHGPYWGQEFSGQKLDVVAMRFDPASRDGASIYLPVGVEISADGRIGLTDHPELLALELPSRGNPKDRRANAALAYFAGTLTARPELLPPGPPGSRRIAVRLVSTEQQVFPELEEAREEIWGAEHGTGLEKSARGVVRNEGDAASRAMLLQMHRRGVAERRLNEATAPPQTEDGMEGYKETRGQRWLLFKGVARWFRETFMGYRLVNGEARRDLFQLRTAVGWVVAIGLGLLTFNLTAAVPLAVGVALVPVLFGAFFGDLTSLSFVEGMQDQMLQGIKGHYDPELLTAVEDCFGDRERSRMQPLAADVTAREYKGLLQEGWDLIVSDPQLRGWVMDYPAMVRFEHPIYKHLGFIPGNVHAEMYAKRRDLASRIQRRLSRLVQARPEAERPRLWRALREAILQNTAGELLAVGNPLAELLYHGSRTPGVNRGGDVNSPFGLDANQRLLLERLMVVLGVPAVQDRSWQRRSAGAFYGGIRIPSLPDAATRDRFLAALQANRLDEARELIRQRRAPMESYLASGGHRPVAEFWLSRTHLQPDKETQSRFLEEESREAVEASPDFMTAEEVDAALSAREDREGLPRGHYYRPGALDLRQLKARVREQGTVRLTANGEWARQASEWLADRPVLSDALTFGSVPAVIGAGAAFLLGAPAALTAAFALAAAPALLYGGFRAGSWLWQAVRNARGEPYSPEAVTLSLLYGVTAEQVRGSGASVQLTETKLDGLFDSAEWDTALGTYAFPGTSIARLPVARRKGTMSKSPPVPFLAAVHLLEQPDGLAQATALLASEAFRLKLTAEDTVFGAVNDHTPRGNPTMNAANIQKRMALERKRELRKKYQALNRAVQLFKGMAMQEASVHLFDHPIFDGYRSDPAALAAQRIFGWDPQLERRSGQSIFGMRASQADEITMGGAAMSGTFVYGYSGFTGTALNWVRVGAFSPGEAQAYWAFRGYESVDRMSGGEFFRVLQEAQQFLQSRLDPARPLIPLPTNPAARNTALLQSRLIDPFLALAQMRAGEMMDELSPSGAAAGLEEGSTGEQDATMDRRKFLRRLLWGVSAVGAATAGVSSLLLLLDRMGKEKQPPQPAPPAGSPEQQRAVEFLNRQITEPKLPVVVWDPATRKFREEALERLPGVRFQLPPTFQFDAEGSRFLADAMRREIQASGRTEAQVSRDYHRALVSQQGRSSTYASAAAVIGLVAAGEMAQAGKILSSLEALEKEGRIGYSYVVTVEGEHDLAQLAGTLAWVGQACLIYAKATPNRQEQDSFRRLAGRIAEILLRFQDHRDLQGQPTGLVRMGQRADGRQIPWASTEHNVEAYFLLRDLGEWTGEERFSAAAEKIARAIEQHLFQPKLGRFNQGYNDPVQALDANTFGALFLMARGREQEARAVRAHIERTFRRDLRMEDGRPVAGYAPYAEHPFIWSEGSFGVGLLDRRLGNADAADRLRAQLAPLQSAGGGFRYAYPATFAQRPDPMLYTSYPETASTAWSILEERNPEAFWTAPKKAGLEEAEAKESAPRGLPDQETAPLTVTSASSPVSVTGAPALSTSRLGLDELPEDRIAVVSPEALGRYPELAAIAGRRVQVGRAHLIVLSPGLTADEMAELVAPFAAMTAGMEEFGEESDPALDAFRNMAEFVGIRVLGRRPIQGGEFLGFFRQIIANLAGLEEGAVDPGALLDLARTLGLQA